MNKPKRILPEMRVVMPICEISFNKGRAQGHTQSCDDWEAFLPDVEEIRTIMQKWIAGTPCNSLESEMFTLSWSYLKYLAEAIAKRIGK